MKLLQFRLYRAQDLEIVIFIFGNMFGIDDYRGGEEKRMSDWAVGFPKTKTLSSKSVTSKCFFPLQMKQSN